MPCRFASPLRRGHYHGRGAAQCAAVESGSVLLIFGGIFVAAYAGPLLHYWHTSPEGVALSHTRDLWRFLRAEQSHRHRIEREAWQDQRQLTRSDRERQERRHDR